MGNLELEAQIDQLFQKVSNYIDNARNNIVRSIDNEMVQAYWLIGHDIVAKEQHGQLRAQYGSGIISNLSKQLTSKYGK